MTDPVAGIELSIDLHHDLLTVRQAAELAFGPTEDLEERRRREQRLHQWRTRGRLKPVTNKEGEPVRDADGRYLFLGIDVLRTRAFAEQADRRRTKHEEPGRRAKHDRP